MESSLDIERDEEMTDAAIIYRTHFEAIENLPEDQRYEALKALVQYCLDDAVPEDGLGSCLLMMAKPVLDKWKSKREAGKRGGEANGSNSEANEKQTESKPEPKVKVKEKVKDIKEKGILTDTQKESPAKAEPLMAASQEIVKYLNEKAGTHYRVSSKETVTMIKARMADGYTVDDFKRVIDVKTAEWKGTEQEQYLRPETLFRPSHFESYLNQPMPKARTGTNKVTSFDRGMVTDYQDTNRELARMIMNGV